jgi:hypothetical protein
VLGPLADPVGTLESSRAVFSPNGRWIVNTLSRGVTGPPTAGRLILRNAQSGEVVAHAEIPNRPSEPDYSTTFAKMLVMSQDGRTIVTAGQATPICVWKVE